jgi:hypothetical protein
MDWLIILIVSLSVFLLIYIFYPSIKKIFSSKDKLLNLIVREIRNEMKNH